MRPWTRFGMCWTRSTARLRISLAIVAAAFRGGRLCIERPAQHRRLKRVEEKKGPRRLPGAFFVAATFRWPRLSALVAFAAGSSCRGRGWRAAAIFLGLLVARFLDKGFARQADLVAFDRQHLYQNLVAELQLIANVADAVFGNFADVQQAVGAGEEFDESAEFRQADNLAKIRLADFRAGGNVANHLQRLVASSSAG